MNKGGQLGGYGGGLWRKQCLLDLERGVRSLLPSAAEFDSDGRVQAKMFTKLPGD